MVEQIIAAGKATLLDAKERYSMRDVFAIWDIVYDEKLREFNRITAERKASRLRR